MAIKKETKDDPSCAKALESCWSRKFALERGIPGREAAYVPPKYTKTPSMLVQAHGEIAWDIGGYGYVDFGKRARDSSWFRRFAEVFFRAESLGEFMVTAACSGLVPAASEADEVELARALKAVKHAKLNKRSFACFCGGPAMRAECGADVEAIKERGAEIAGEIADTDLKQER